MWILCLQNQILIQIRKLNTGGEWNSEKSFISPLHRLSRRSGSWGSGPGAPARGLAGGCQEGGLVPSSAQARGDFLTAAREREALRSPLFWLKPPQVRLCAAFLGGSLRTVKQPGKWPAALPLRAGSVTGSGSGKVTRAVDVVPGVAPPCGRGPWRRGLLPASAMPRVRCPSPPSEDQSSSCVLTCFFLP